jgi:hypothetical protein
MGIHSTQDKTQVKVQTKDRTNPLDLEQMKMNKILLMIHVLTALACPNVLDTDWLDMIGDGNDFNKHSHRTTIVRIYMRCT